MFERPPERCDFCRDETSTKAIDVPYFERTYRICAPCAHDWHAGGYAIDAYEPPYAPDTTWRWPGPAADDAAAFLASIPVDVEMQERATARFAASGARESLDVRVPAHARWIVAERQMFLESEWGVAFVLAAAVACDGDLGPFPELSRFVARRARHDLTSVLLGLYAHSQAHTTFLGQAFQRKPSASQEAWLQAAQREYLCGCSFRAANALEARVAGLHVFLRMERGHWDDAEAALTRHRQHAKEDASLQDPRFPFARAVLAARVGDRDGLDRSLSAVCAAVRAAQQPDLWRSAHRHAVHDQVVRAIEGDSWARVRDRLRDLLELDPHDVRAQFDLAHAYVKCSLDPVARVVLEGALDEHPRRHVRDLFEQTGRAEAVTLYGTCLLRLNELSEARDVLETHLERFESEPAHVDHLHLLGLVLERRGDDDAALTRLRDAHARAHDWNRRVPAVRRHALTLLVRKVRALLLENAAGTPQRVGSLLDAHRELITEEFGTHELHLLAGFLHAELARRFGASGAFGMDPFQNAVGAKAIGDLALAYRHLERRQLPDAVRAERRARSQGGSPVPLECLLLFLHAARDDDSVRALLDRLSQGP